MMRERAVTCLLVIAVLACWPASAASQATAPAPAPQVQDDPDLDLVPLQPEFTVVSMQTALRLPRYKSWFRVTHRFLRPLGSGDFSDLLNDAFGLDSSAQIGLEYRFGIMRGTQIGVNRTSNRTIELYAHRDVIQERDGRWVNLAAIFAIDGTNNFRDSYSPAIGAVVSRSFAPIGTLFVQPMWVNNSNPLPSEVSDDNDTFFIGVGTRVRVRPTVYLVGEVFPRVSGFMPGVNQASFGIEKRAGGHMFQLNFSNAVGTTVGQIARGGFRSDDWFLGFQISRKFF